MLEHIYFARHGFRQGFDWPTSPTGTKRDPPLTAHGINQAKELADFFERETKDAKLRLDMIYSSPYYRCLQTASYTADRLGLPIHVEFGVSEFFQTVTPNTGLHPRPPHAESLRRYFSQIASPTTHDPLLFAPREGETITEIHERAIRFLGLLIDHVDRTLPNVKTVLLVSHAATVITLGRALSGDREKDVRAGTCSLSHYERVSEERESNRGLGEWTCKLNGSTEHLKQGEERHWEFSMVEEDMCDDGLGEEALILELQQGSHGDGPAKGPEPKRSSSNCSSSSAATSTTASGSPTSKPRL